MKKSILNLKGAQELSKNEQKKVNGGIKRPRCGGDGSFITVGGLIVCCYVSGGYYIC